MKKVGISLSVVLLLTLAFVCIGLADGNAEALTPGTYTVTQRGFAADFTISVTVDENKITGIEVVKTQDTVGIGERAQRMIAKSIVESQSTDVDIMTGATVSSLTMINAVRNALAEAGATKEMFAEDKKSPAASNVLGTIEEFQQDIIIVGGGLAGWVAAFNAAEQGARVLLLEQNSFFGGSSMYAGGAIAQSGSQFQLATYPDATGETFAQWLISSNEGIKDFDPVMAKTLAEESGPALDKLIGWGLKLLPTLGAIGNGAAYAVSQDAGEY